jgi:hypothetical protein
MKNSQRQTDHLQILASSGGRNIPRFRSDIKYDRSLKPGNKEMGALFNNVFFDSCETIENYGTSSTPYIVHCTSVRTFLEDCVPLGSSEKYCCWNGEARAIAEDSLHQQEDLGM